MAKLFDFVALAKLEAKARDKARADGAKLEAAGKAEIKAQADGKTATVYVNGYVDYYQYVDITEAAIMAGDSLERVDVRINSAGGSAYAGVAIHNFLRSLDAKITTYNDSIALSAAAMIFMAGSERLMGEGGSTLMFHNAMGWIDILEFGNAADLESVDTESLKNQAMEYLKDVDEKIVKMMTTGTKLDRDGALALMLDPALKDGKPLGNEEALELGLATGTSGAESADAGETESEGDKEKESENVREEGAALVASVCATLEALEEV